MPDEELDHKDHWEVLFDKTYLRWFHLQGKPCVVTIATIVRDVELTMRGGIKKKAWLIHFVGKEKPLVMNVTNASTIATIHGNKPSQWPGKKVTLYPTTTRMYKEESKKMETVGCIRIKPENSKEEK